MVSFCYKIGFLVYLLTNFIGLRQKSIKSIGGGLMYEQSNKIPSLFGSPCVCVPCINLAARHFFRCTLNTVVTTNCNVWTILVKIVSRDVYNNMKLSCRKKAARYFVSLKILLSHSRSFKIVWRYTDEYGVRKLLLVIDCMPKYMSVLYRYWHNAASNIVVTLKSKLGVTQGHWIMNIVPFETFGKR